MVPKIPKGTETRKTRRHATGASTPPSTRPMKEPAMKATLLMPRPMPRCSGGKASVTMAAELENSMAPPMPWPMRIAMSQTAPAPPSSQVTERRMEKMVNTAKPRL